MVIVTYKILVRKRTVISFKNTRILFKGMFLQEVWPKHVVRKYSPVFEIYNCYLILLMLHNYAIFYYYNNLNQVTHTH